MNSLPDEALMIGDDIKDDILGANEEIFPNKDNLGDIEASSIDNNEFNSKRHYWHNISSINSD